MASTDRDAIEFRWMNRLSLGAVAGESVLLVPIGATEQHGRALPTGTDTLHTEAVAKRAAQILAGAPKVVVAPAMPFGCSDHHVQFGATISLSSRTLLSVLEDIGRSAVRSGFRSIFFLNGHGGNQDVVKIAARDLGVELRAHFGGGSWWEMARDEILECLPEPPMPMPGHAGAFEASLLRAIDPHLPLADKPQDDACDHLWPTSPALYRHEPITKWTDSDGYSDDPSAGNEELGNAILEHASRAVAQHLAEFGGAVAPDS